MSLKKIPWFWLGLLSVMILIAPYLLLGHGVYIQMTDQLDGEVLNYIYRAKYLFLGDGCIPELMNGVSAAAMTPPALVGVLFYKLFSPFAAFACMHGFVLIAGYIGMYLLSKELTGSDFVSAVTSILFVYLPFYPVYGLSILGQPLLIWALLRIYKSEGKKILYYLVVLLYGFCSSFALVGFAWLAVLGIVCVWLAARRKASGYRSALDCPKTRVISLRSVMSMWAAFALLLVTYILCNLNLVGDMLGIGGSFVAHREEMIIAELGFAENFKTIFFEGGSYAKSYNIAIFLLAVFAILLKYITKSVVVGRRCVDDENFDNNSAESVNGECMEAAGDSAGLIFVLMLAALIISVLAALWRIEPVVNIRMNAGGALKSFQADRIYWLLPVCWYMILALCLKEMGILLKNMAVRLREKTGHLRRIIAGAGLCSVSAVTCCLILALAFMIYDNSTIYHNLRLIVFPDTYHLMDWDDFYAEDVFEQIDEFIGVDKSEYRTVSLGITPAAALYNGFYCLDGYSNFYPLQYKHEFREIIADELSKSEELRVYFDAWGNRCYLFNGETGNFMMIPGVNGGSFEHLELNTSKLYEMGGRYIFSALPIENAEDMNLVLLRDEPFETETSYYSIWLYGIEGM